MVEQPVKNQPNSKKPVLGLDAIIDLVRASATEISGSEMDENAHFASHQFDSLSAVELANSIGRAVGLSLPSTMQPLATSPKLQLKLLCSMAIHLVT